MYNIQVLTPKWLKIAKEEYKLISKEVGNYISTDDNDIKTGNTEEDEYHWTQTIKRTN